MKRPRVWYLEGHLESMRPRYVCGYFPVAGGGLSVLWDPACYRRCLFLDEASALRVVRLADLRGYEAFSEDASCCSLGLDLFLFGRPFRILFAQGDGLAAYLDWVSRIYFLADRRVSLSDVTVFSPFSRSDLWR